LPLSQRPPILAEPTIRPYFHEDHTARMRTAAETAPKGAPAQDLAPQGRSSEPLLKELVSCLDEAKAEEVVTIDLAGKSTIGDFMVIATGRTDRHVGAIADQLRKHLREAGLEDVRVGGQENCDWVVVDAGDIIIHVFRPEVRDFYNLEKIWSVERPADTTH
jgi:ribosome-associated protein